MKAPTTMDRIEAQSIPEPNTGCWLWLSVVVGFEMDRR